jgi:hypothetical protein
MEKEEGMQPNRKRGLIPVERIEQAILLIRRQKVILDVDLADLYDVPTKALNQAVTRNERRFPPDFMFRLTKEEKDELVTNCDRFERLKHSSAFPRAFTEQGVAMLASVLNSDTAIEVNIEIMRAFVRLRQMLSAHKDLERKLHALEGKYDKQFKVVFDAIRDLMAETLQFAKENLPARVYSKDLIELLFHQPYTKVQFLVRAGIAERKTAADYLKALERIGTLQIYRMGKENLYLNKKLFDTLSK